MRKQILAIIATTLLALLPMLAHADNGPPILSTCRGSGGPAAGFGASGDILRWGEVIKPQATITISHLSFPIFRTSDVDVSPHYAVLSIYSVDETTLLPTTALFTSAHVSLNLALPSGILGPLSLGSPVLWYIGSPVSPTVTLTAGKHYAIVVASDGLTGSNPTAIYYMNFSLNPDGCPGEFAVKQTNNDPWDVSADASNNTVSLGYALNGQSNAPAGNGSFDVIGWVNKLGLGDSAGKAAVVMAIVGLLLYFALKHRVPSTMVLVLVSFLGVGGVLATLISSWIILVGVLVVGLLLFLFIMSGALRQQEGA